MITLLSETDIDELVENYCFPWNSQEKTTHKWTRYLEEQQKKIRTVAIIKHSNKIVGYGSLLYTSEYPFFINVPEISDVWIHENHRGKGFGTKLIQWLETLATTLDFKEIGIGVGLYSDYGNAQKLYAKLGYIPDGKGITYQYKQTEPGASYPLDDDLILWLKKSLDQGHKN